MDPCCFWCGSLFHLLLLAAIIKLLFQSFGSLADPSAPAPVLWRCAAALSGAVFFHNLVRCFLVFWLGSRCLPCVFHSRSLCIDSRELSCNALLPLQAVSQFGRVSAVCLLRLVGLSLRRPWLWLS